MNAADRYLSASSVALMLGVSVPTVWRWTREGRLPRPLKIAPRTTRWREADVRRAAEREGAA